MTETASDTVTATERFRAARDFLLKHRTDYTAAYRDFIWPEFDTFNWARDWFDVIARGNDRPALWLVEEDGAETVRSFAEMAERSSRVANWLRSQGVKRRDRIIIMLGNQVELWETILAANKLGAVIIPATTLLGPEDLRDRVSRGEARHVVARSADAAKFDNVPGEYTRIACGDRIVGWLAYSEAANAAEEFEPDGITHAADPLLLYFTSGTTALPKLVEHTQVSYPVGHLSTMYWIGLQPGDIHLNISSPGWAKHAWSNVFAPWNAGATVFLYNYERFNAGALLDQMVRCGITTFCAPPTVWRMLIQEDLGRWKPPLRELVGAGEPLNPEVIQQVRNAWGLTIRDGYGQTETTALAGNPPDQPVKPGSMGRPLPGYRVQLLDPLTDQPSDEGEICLDLSPRPVGLMVRYLDDPGRTAKVMRDGFYHTGDVAALDTDGYISYVGRTDDVFKASDYRISPFELESVLIEHPAVAEAAVVPSPDPLRLAVPKAYIALIAGHEPGPETAESILRFCRERVAPYKRIRRLEFSELPKTISGKIRRVDLREHAKQSRGRDEGGEEFREEEFRDRT